MLQLRSELKSQGLQEILDCKGQVSMMVAVLNRVDGLTLGAARTEGETKRALRAKAKNENMARKEKAKKKDKLGFCWRRFEDLYTCFASSWRQE